VKIVKSIKQMHSIVLDAKRKNKTIGFVPTMGYLHHGHCSLLRRCRKENDLSVLSIFVNPVQFSPTEDFTKYPRDLKRDEKFAKDEKVDIIFYPSVDEIYPDGYRTFVQVDGLSDKLCGKFRPGHFRGVSTVVMKLVNIVAPDTLYLGQKDAQQALIIQRMLKDLNTDVRVKILPTVREKSGLAMSSRNSYLAPEHHAKATILYRSLQHAKTIIEDGERNPETVIEEMRVLISSEGAEKIDYIECVDAQTLLPLDDIKGDILIAVAVWFGTARLIDNITVSVTE